MLKRVTSLLLCALMVCSAAFLVSCNKDDENTGSTAAVGDIAGFKPEKKDWGGAAVNILGYREDGRMYSECQIDIEETNGESVNDAFYKRNEIIKSNFNLDINLVLPDEGEDQVAVLKKDMEAGLNEIDAIMTGVHYIAPLAISGDLVDLGGENIKYLNLQESWWDQNLPKDLDINGRCYFITGDALVNDDEATYAMFYNKDIANTYGLENLYDIVNEGKWTMDKMYEMIEQVSNDQEKAWSTNTESVWGMITQSYDILSFMHGFEQPLIDNTGDTPYFRVDSSENQGVFLEIHEILNDKINVAIADQYGSWKDTPSCYDVEVDIFTAGKSLFMPNSLSLVNSTDLRETEISFGIVPMPKYEESQETYVTSVNVYACAVFAVPKTNEGERLDRTCYALEAMAYFGQKYVTDEYYTRTVSLKRLKDERDSEMLDLIFDNKIYDMACVFDFGASPNVSGSLYFYSEILYEGNIASHWEKKEIVYQEGLDDLIGTAYYD